MQQFRIKLFLPRPDHIEKGVGDSDRAHWVKELVAKIDIRDAHKGGGNYWKLSSDKG